MEHGIDRQTQMHYSPQGWVVGRTVHEANQLFSHETWTHDDSGKILGHCVSRVGTSCANAFANGPIYGVSPPGTVVTGYEWDLEERPWRVWDADGVYTQIDYDVLGRKIRESRHDRETRWTYDVLNRVVEVAYGTPSVVAALGAGHESFVYDGFGRLLTHTDRRGNDWQRVWDVADRLRLKMIHNLPNQLDWSGGEEVTSFEYGTFGRVSAQVVDPGGLALRTEFERRQDGQVFKVGGTGISDRYISRDASGRPLVELDQSGRTLYTYSANGLTQTQTRVTTGPDGQPDISVTTERQLDRTGMMVEENVIERGGLTRTTTQSRVFTAGLVRYERKDPTDRIATTFNDLAGYIHQRIEEVPGGVDITDYGVNGLGQIEQITDPSGGVTVQEFNAFGERTSLTKPSPGPLDVHGYGFDAYGRLMAWERHGIEVSWVWDDRSDMVEERYRVSPSGPLVTLNTFQYDLVGRKISAVGKNPILQQELGFSQVEAGVEHGWAYDAASRVTGQFMGAGTFDGSVMTDYTVTAGNVWETTSTHALGVSSTGFAQVRGFDGVGRRISDQPIFGGFVSTIDHRWTGHRQIGREHARNGGATRIDLELNGFWEMVEASAYRGNEGIHREQLERDVLGRVRSVRLNSRDEDKDTWYGFEYDARHALGTSWEGSVPRGAGNPGSSGNGNATGNGNAYGIGNGNAPNTTVGSHNSATNTSVASRAGSLNAVPFERTRAQAIGTLKGIAEDGVPIWEATHSASGHRLTEVSDGLSTWSIAHDPLGRVTQAIDKEFVYDPLGRLVLVKVAGEVVESLHYDGDGRLARVNRHDTNGYTPSVFVYEGEQMASSWTNSGSWSRDWQAVWGPSQDELLEFHDFVAGRTLRVVPDHRNSIAALIDESTGQIHAMARYTPEGLMRVLEPDGSVLCDERASLDTTCALPIPFGFNGMWRSEQSGLSYMRNRWYSPQLAQFMSHDPLEYIDSFNLYAFATLDPINFWDPWGLCSSCPTPRPATADDRTILLGALDELRSLGIYGGWVELMLSYDVEIIKSDKVRARIPYWTFLPGMRNKLLIEQTLLYDEGHRRALLSTLVHESVHFGMIHYNSLPSMQDLWDTLDGMYGWWPSLEKFEAPAEYATWVVNFIYDFHNNRDTSRAIATFEKQKKIADRELPDPSARESVDEEFLRFDPRTPNIWAERDRLSKSSGGTLVE